MLPLIMLGVAGIVFMLGFISLQLAAREDAGAIERSFTLLAFLACAALAVFIGFGAFTLGLPSAPGY